MIYKELDPFQSEDKFARSGRAAEEQMAFYLKRFFSSDPDFLVLNGIRLEVNGDAAQVDHLVIHSHGLSIVESKSVHGKIQIKDDGQWIRWYNGNQSRGMASPVTQARLQERFFREVLGKASNNHALFAKLPIDVFVAISDDGVILWPKAGPVAGICKADQVPDKIIEGKRSRAAVPDGLVLSENNRKKIADFLIAANKPLIRASASSSIPPSTKEELAVAEVVARSAETDQSTAVCKHCGSNELEIRYGYTYYFFCKQCEKNTPIKPTCPQCDVPAKLHKKKHEFFLECEKCQQSALYFVNSQDNTKSEQSIDAG